MTDDNRFSRFSLISWWDQQRLAEARVLVVGAGALGNEIVKNLALLGIGQLALVDMDVVEISNLSRSILFRARDRGRPKADVACEAACDVFPGLRAWPVRADVTHEVGMGLFRWADVVVGALDNREARLAISRFCNLTSRVWIDGGIDVLSGIVRVFVPGTGPCYECTLSDVDWRILDQRRACTLLPRGQASEPRVPTTPTTASIIAGMQCAEAIKILHGVAGLDGEGIAYDGRGYDSYRVRYERDPDCFGHETLPRVEDLLATSSATRVGTVVEEIRARLGAGAVVEACRELVASMRCESCGAAVARRGAMESLTADDAACPTCGRPLAPVLYHRLDTSPCDPEATLREIGLPPWDVIRGRAGDRECALEITGDRALVLPDVIDDRRGAAVEKSIAPSAHSSDDRERP